ncbi:MAG: site-2 protease family protein [Candidatus Aenigmarchaeota archaeon]|nr:site-2 protease family protein [Candidatus Aenigmarchaeota archaeon]
MAVLDIISFAAFIVLMAVLVYRDRKHVKLQGVMFIRRTEKGKASIDRMTKRHQRFWNVMSYLGIATAVLALVAGVAFLATSSLTILQGKDAEGVRFVLPYPSGEAQLQPGLLLLPWWVWIIAIFSVVVPHEVFHGIMCRLHNVRIKSLGWLLLVIIPGAFVEPDERQLKRAARTVRMKVYAAGSFANILISVIALLFLSLLFVAFSPAGILFAANETSSFGSNVTGFVTSIDGMPVTSVAALSSAMAAHQPGDTVTIAVAEEARVVPHLTLSRLGEGQVFEPVAVIETATARAYTVTLQEHPGQAGKPYIGVLIPSAAPAVSYNLLGYSMYTLLFWVFVLNLGIGIVNILPIKPLDGGLLFEELLGGVQKNALLVKAVSGIALFLLLFNIFGPMLV